MFGKELDATIALAAGKFPSFHLESEFEAFPIGINLGHSRRLLQVILVEYIRRITFTQRDSTSYKVNQPGVFFSQITHTRR